MAKKMIVSVIGAGGKMGTRVTNNLAKHQDTVELNFCETSEAGIAAIQERGFNTVPAETAVPASDIIILAVPDKIIQVVSVGIVEMMTPGSTLRHPVRRPCALEPAVSAVYWGAHGLRTLPPGTACSTSRLFRSLLMRRLCHVNWDSFRQSVGTKCGDEVYPTKRGDKV